MAPMQYLVEDFTQTLRTKVPFEHTRNRYPWVCSLRSRDSTPKHLCAVTLLSIPPKPTVFVGPAHCTFLCKISENVAVPSCCCADGPSETCSDNTTLCGETPQVFFMTSLDATIICGEWETGNVSSSESEEKYNVFFPIVEIVRHPNFTTVKGGGPIDGNDIAVFQVDDREIKNNRANELKVWPACLPLEKRTASRGVHAGWSQPPPPVIFENILKGYRPFYSDFFKQWHLSMDIMTRCQDPQNNWIRTDVYNNGPLKYPSNTSFPAGTFCAKDFARQTCFAQGDSGSPLMTQEKSRPERMVAEGFLSFVKGCEFIFIGNWFSDTSWVLDQLTDSPMAYTKLSCFLPWIAKVSNMEFDRDEDVEEECLQGAGNPLDIAEKGECRSINNWNYYIRDNPKCIFPFYYNGRRYEECTIFTIFDWVYLPRCPIRDIVTKINGINSYNDGDAAFGIAVGGYITNPYCPTDVTDPTSPLDPDNEDCADNERRYPIAACNYNCPGVRAFGVIGGGAALALVSSTSLLGSLGGLGVFGPLVGITAAGALAIGTTRMMCMGPIFCRVNDQCCVLVNSINGLDCPDSC